MPQRPRVFVGSSSEGLPVAEAIREHLTAWAEPHLWNEPGVFRLGVTTLDNLKAQARQYAAALLIFSPDDIAEVRGVRYLIGRDNVLFEMGLFMGVLPLHRVIFAIPRGELPFKVPSDLAGYVYGTYVHADALQNAKQATQGLAKLIRDALTQALPGGIPARTIRGPMAVHNLRAIGPGAGTDIDPVFVYEVPDAELVIDAARVSLRGHVNMNGPVALSGTIEGHGEFLNGAVYMIYTIRDEDSGHILKGTGVLQVPALGPTATGFWMSEASVDAGRQMLAVGCVRVGSGASTAL